jgi:hypothetical protein
MQLCNSATLLPYGRMGGKLTLAEATQCFVEDFEKESDSVKQGYALY